MAVSANLDALLDKKYEELPLEQVLEAPVAALAGVSEADGELLKKAFNITTVADLGRNKHFRAAAALLDLHNASK
ncbi:hypothetical protein [Streptoalloteichus hindustanus]|uniref:Uncharacterized protein n=1 Tax=Streptoalloteichus hindustanus TaxID=2017 RepID=A0A1M5P0A4_STRHI|nr:hypothetical protein [Streptoalloteichus hindustanus]SHG95202.1 hypothetical protein SAMN05444320_11725 [Streptoalloteichus hindustanus]